jgi:Bacteriophage head to tail connecting protein
MKTRVQELMKSGDQLYSKRFPLLTLWQSFAENFYPIRADMTRARYISEEFASYLMTGRPVLAHRELANALSSILRPRDMRWFEARTGDEAINQDRACKEWLERAGAAMRRVMYDRASQFTRATKEGDADYILFGQCVIEPRINARGTGMLYRTWHLRDCVWAENADLVIDQFHRKWKLDARSLARLFPDAVAPDVKTKAEKDPFTEINCRVIVLPADEYDSYGKDEDDAPRERLGHPFVQIVVDEDHQTILEEIPQPDLGYVIPRWITIGGFSQYAYSPTAIVALPDARMLQQMTLTLIEIGQKIVDPPMIAVGDAIQGGTNLYAGAINWVDPDYDERTGEVLRPITVNGEGLQWGTEYEQRIEQVINEAFFLNVLNLPEFDSKVMTATEIQTRMKEYIRRATPLFEPVDLEYNGQLCQATFAMLDRMGMFGSFWDRPPALRGQKIEFKFQNPLVQAEAEAKTVSFTKMAQLLGAAMQIDPTVRADFDVDTAYRDAVDGTGAPARWLFPKDKADAIKAQARAQQAAAQHAADLGHLGEQAGKVANAVKNVGEAGTALQEAGLV